MTKASFLKFTSKTRIWLLAGAAANALWLTGACDDGFTDCATTYTCPASPKSGGSSGMSAAGQSGMGTGGGEATVGGTGSTAGAGSLAGAGGSVSNPSGGAGGGSVGAEACSTNHGGCDPLATCTDNVGAAPTCGACPPGYIGTGATACTPTLTALTLSSGTLTPALSADVTVYSAAVGLGAQTITLTPTVPTDAKVTIAGQAVISGASWTSPVLNLSANAITIVVSQDGHPSQNYTLTVNRGMSQEAYVKASNAAAYEFGDAVALSNDGSTLAVGAFQDSSNATLDDYSGAVYVFTRSGTTWSQQAYLRGSNTEPVDFFGFSVSLSGNGDTLAVGAPAEDSAAKGVNGSQGDNSALAAGAAYVFTRTGNAWTQQAYVKASNTEGFDRFGTTVTLSQHGSFLAVTAQDEASSGVNGSQTDNSMEGSGAVYVFARATNTWTQQAYLKASNAGAGDFFGGALGLSADGATLAVGAPAEAGAAIGVNPGNGSQTDNSAAASGAVYLFARSGEAWAQQAYLKASNTGAGDNFGSSLSLSQDGATLAVGASGEDSNGDPTNNGAAGSGAVYVYARANNVWNQGAYLKASNLGAGDGFGGSVALSNNGDTLVACASGEDSNATGINGNQSNNDALGSGAAYVLARSGSTWVAQAYVKASSAGGAFGRLCALSGDGGTLAVAGGNAISVFR
ncbi:MAG: cadherin-like beta sandwich domain-containing protein [Polyangiaceae bacterium]|nr:cadherin-like beta sandwich domain-containing protein [Polyangiaceae bacterium]